MKKIFKSDLTTMTNEQIYMELVKTCSEMIATDSKKIEGDRKVYYISSEFLIGKLLSNNLINLKIYDQVKVELAEA